MNSICTPPEPAKESISFVKEIQMMMFGLGDSPTPLVSTASMIEEIVLRQLVSILVQAEEVAERRGVDGIYPQDILFLMRKDVHKLNRIVTYIGFKEYKKNITSSLNDGDMPGLEDLLPSTDVNRTESRRKHTCVQFLLTLGINLDEIASIDAVKHERMRRVLLRTQAMPNKTFEEFYASRRATFLGARLNIGRFVEWLRQAPDCPSHKLKTFTVEMLLYLAKETTAQLVDQALLLRRDSAVTPFDPFSRAQRTSLPFETFGPSQRQLEGPPPITPGEVREVLRRYYSTQLHPWGTFTCNLDPAVFNKILAC